MRYKIYIKYLIIAIVVTCSSFRTNAQIQLSPNAEFSLLTCSPGKEVYSLFGHTAIRIKDSVLMQDIVFNYGIFDFSTENFLWKFVKGETYYQLGVHSFESFIQSYINEERNVWEQNLNLTPTQKEELIRLLINDYKPENRTYLYNFLYNNCATKVRDHLEAVLNINSYPVVQPDISFRQLIKEYVYKYRWVQLGINLALGKPLDRITSTREQLFLPMELMTTYAHMGFSSTELAVYPNKIHKHKGIHPALIFGLIIALIIISNLFKIKWLNLIHQTLMIILLTTGGIILILLSYFSIHPAVQPNLLILLINPLMVFPLIYINKNTGNDTLKNTFAILIAVLFTTILLSGQSISISIILLILAIILSLLGKLILKKMQLIQ